LRLPQVQDKTTGSKHALPRVYTVWKVQGVMQHHTNEG
jgi:hypothetical protein